MDTCATEIYEAKGNIVECKDKCSGYLWENGTCVQSCSRYYKSNTEKYGEVMLCVGSCPNKEKCDSEDRCECVDKCEDKVQGNRCVENCEEDYFVEESECVKTCGEDYFIEGSRCVTKCSEGLFPYKHSRMCSKNCIVEGDENDAYCVDMCEPPKYLMIKGNASNCIN